MRNARVERHTRWYILAYENGHQRAGDMLDEVFYFGGPDYIRKAAEAFSPERVGGRAWAKRVVE